MIRLNLTLAEVETLIDKLNSTPEHSVLWGKLYEARRTQTRPAPTNELSPQEPFNHEQTARRAIAALQSAIKTGDNKGICAAYDMIEGTEFDWEQCNDSLYHEWHTLTATISE